MLLRGRDFSHTGKKRCREKIPLTPSLRCETHSQVWEQALTPA